MKHPFLRAIPILLAAAVALNLTAAGKPKAHPKSTLRLHSESFKDGGMMDAKYSLKGGNVSPELNWTGAPSQSKYFVILMEDPDAPMKTWVHWVIYNIPAKPTDPTSNKYELLEGYPRDEKTPQGILQGVNDFLKVGYDGPDPPSGLHRYFFKLYALDAPLKLPAGETRDQVLKALAKHTLAWTQIMGLYGK